MSGSGIRSISYLNESGNVETARKWEGTGRGVIIPVGAASEVLIPWHRALEIWDGRDLIDRS